jgi:large subunit ribosomal protein L29
MGINKKLNQEDIKQYVTEDLISKIASEQSELKRLEFNHAVTPLDNPLSIRAKRKDVARLLTEMTSRKKEQKA